MPVKEGRTQTTSIARGNRVPAELPPTLALRRAARSAGTLQTVLVGLAVVYGLFAVLNSWKLPSDPGRQVVLLNILLLATYGGAATLHRRWGPLPYRLAEPAIALAFVLAQANTLNTSRLFDDPLYLVFVGLAIVALPCFQASDRWFVLGISTHLLGWVAVRWATGSSLASIRSQLFFLIASVLLAIVVYSARRNGLVALGRVMGRSEADRALLHRILDGAHDLIFSIDDEGRMLLVNQAWSQCLGYSREEVVGTPAAEYVHPESREEFRATLANLTEGQASPMRDFVWVSRAGKRVYMQGHLQSATEVSPGLIAAQGYFRDRTSEYKLERNLARQEALLQQFAEASHQVFWIYDPRISRFLYINDAFSELTGFERSDILTDSNVFLKLFVPEDLPTIRGLLAQIRQGQPVTTEHRLVRCDGTLRWVRLNAYPLFDDSEVLQRIAGVSEDITPKKELELALARSEANLRARERLLQQFVAKTPAAVAMFDREMTYLAASERWRADLGLGTEELVGRRHQEVWPEISIELRQALAAALAGEEVRSNEDPLVRPDGAMDWIRWEVRPWTTGEGEVGGVLMFCEVITEDKRVRDALRREASIDSLTGLANRATFERDLRRIWSRCREDGVEAALFYVDLDGFKEINDTHGHAAGDRVLTAVAERLREVCRPGDLISRIGGDEFLILARTVDSEPVAAELSRRIATTVQQPIAHDSQPLQVGVSVGYALTSQATGPEALVDLADQAMYREKARGKEAGAEPVAGADHESLV